jgi:hypothetical protein
MKRKICLILITGLALACLISTGCTHPDSGTTPGGDHKQTVAIPVFNISTGDYSSDQSITITCATSGADIHYTVNDTGPVSSSPVYSSAISVSGHMTVMKIRAIAMKAGMLDSTEASVTITINYDKVSTPQFNPVGGTYKKSQSVTVTCVTTGVTIRYTTNNIDPSATSGNVYSGPVSVSANCTLKAIAYKSGMTDSTIASSDYYFTPAAPAINVTPGTHKITVTWSAVTGATSYNLYYAKGATVDTSTGTKVEVTTGTTAEIAFSQGGDTYAFMVTAVNTYGEGSESSIKTSVPDKGWFWTAKGGAGFSAGSANYTSLAIDSKNVPYVAFEYGKLNVMKYNGTTWETVGNANFSAGVVLNVSLAIDGNDVPYVTYSDAKDSYKIIVKKLNGTTWETVGNAGFSNGTSYSNSLTFDSNNVPYVAFSDGNDLKATVMKFNGTTWETVGNAGFSAGSAVPISLSMDSNNIPYVAYRDYANGHKATVMKFNGTTWETIGSAGFSAGRAFSIKMAVDSNNVPHIAYRDPDNSDKATVMKFNGTTWDTVGTAGFSAGKTDFISLAIDSNNVPYVAYWDGANGGKTTVMKFNGNAWVNVGNAGLSADIAQSISLVIDSNNVPNVAYQDYGNGCKATLMSYEYR